MLIYLKKGKNATQRQKKILCSYASTGEGTVNE